MLHASKSSDVVVARLAVITGGSGAVPVHVQVPVASVGVVRMRLETPPTGRFLFPLQEGRAGQWA